MTNHWNDIKNADVIIIMGGNAAVAHPVGFKYVTEAMEQRGAKLVVVDPIFTKSAALADLYAPLRSGSDIAFLGGVINYLIKNDKIHWDYVKAYTNAPFLISKDYSFKDGLFSGYNGDKRSYDRTSWGYEIGADGFAVVDETLENPRCVWQLMKQHYANYTPEYVERTCGTPKDKFLKVCELIASTAGPDKVMTSMYALGWTQHSKGSQNIRAMAMIQLLLGNVGRPGGGINALRGHANVQGATDQNPFPNALPGYLAAPADNDETWEQFLERRTPKPLRPNQVNYYSHTPAFVVSLMKAWYGDAATKENDWAYEWLPKLGGGAYDEMDQYERMYQGKMNGLIVHGANPLYMLPNVTKGIAAMSKLKFLVVIDPIRTETSEFWMPEGDLYKVKPEDIKTEVIRLPSSLFAEDDGTFANSGRVIQWHAAGQEPPGEGKRDLEILGQIFTRVRALYAKEGGAFPDPILKLTWPYAKPTFPGAEEVLREINGRALTDVLGPVDPKDPKAPRKVLVPAGSQVPGFAVLQEDGSTACGNWIYSGVYPATGNAAMRRDNSDPSGMGAVLGWGFAWPANRHVLYNTANINPATGKAWDPTRPSVSWNGKAWVGNDVADMVGTVDPASGAKPFIMTPEGVARLFAIGMVDGPFPEHYEPFESPVGGNTLHPAQVTNPVARIFKGDAAQLGKADKYPYVATTYRVAEHFHSWTKHSVSNSILSPRQYVEIGEELALEKALKSGDMVRVTTPRGEMVCPVAVTKRIKVLNVEGKKVHTIGIPIHWGTKGVAKAGYMVNYLTPVVGDANTQTPEYKAFLVNLVKA